LAESASTTWNKELLMNQTADDSTVPSGFWCPGHHGRAYAFGELVKRVESFHGYPEPEVLIGATMVAIGDSAFYERKC
jgi:hypothetical protein